MKMDRTWSLGKSTPALLFPLFLNLACGANEAHEGPMTRSLTVHIDQADTRASEFGLTGDEPVFIGLGLEDQEGALQSFTLNTGENVIELELEDASQAKSAFRATLMTARPSDPYALLVSQARGEVLWSKDPGVQELVLNFSPYERMQKVNVYGLVHADAQTPAAGALVTALDPASGAPVAAPGLSFLAEADSYGAYAFSFPYDALEESQVLKLRISYGDKTYFRELALPPAGLPGHTLNPLNLAGDGEVQPTFLNLEDFDGDGTPNETEIAKGTNPFSALSGAKGDKGDKGDTGERGIQGEDGISTGMTISQVSDVSICPRGGTSFQPFADLNKNGTQDAGEDDLGAPMIQCTTSTRPMLALNGGVVGELLGTATRYIWETLSGFLVPVLKSGENYIPERVSLFYETDNCSGSENHGFAEFQPLGTGVYVDGLEQMWTNPDGRIVFMDQLRGRLDADANGTTCTSLERGEMLIRMDRDRTGGANGLPFMQFPSSFGQLFIPGDGRIYVTDGTPDRTDGWWGGQAEPVQMINGPGGDLFLLLENDGSWNLEKWIDDGSGNPKLSASRSDLSLDGDGLNGVDSGGRVYYLSTGYLKWLGTDGSNGDVSIVSTNGNEWFDDAIVISNVVFGVSLISGATITKYDLTSTGTDVTATFDQNFTPRNLGNSYYRLQIAGVSAFVGDMGFFTVHDDGSPLYRECRVLGPCRFKEVSGPSSTYLILSSDAGIEVFQASHGAVGFSSTAVASDSANFGGGLADMHLEGADYDSVTNQLIVAGTKDGSTGIFKCEFEVSPPECTRLIPIGASAKVREVAFDQAAYSLYVLGDGLVDSSSEPYSPDTLLVSKFVDGNGQSLRPMRMALEGDEIRAQSLMRVGSNIVFLGRAGRDEGLYQLVSGAEVLEDDVIHVPARFESVDETPMSDNYELTVVPVP